MSALKDRIQRLELKVKEMGDKMQDFVKVAGKPEVMLTEMVQEFILDAVKKASKNLKSLTLFWEIQGLSEKISAGTSFTSEVYQLVEFGCNLKFKFDPWRMIFTVEYLQQLKNDSFPLNGHHAITFIVEDQSGQHPKQNFIRKYEPSFDGSNKSTLEFQLLAGWKSFLQRFARNGRINVKIIVERLVDLVNFEPRQFGTLIWKINNFEATLQKHLSGLEYSWSETFYLSEKGYRLKLFLRFGDNEIQCRLYFLKGPWDKTLPKISKSQMTLKIVNQDDPSGSSDLSITSEDESFKPLHGIKNYVNDDSLVIHFIFRRPTWF